MSRSALLVIVGLWWTPEQKPKRPSVLLFLRGVGKDSGDFNIYYANFYEKVGFRMVQDEIGASLEKNSAGKISWG
jgi:hypothetical protein